MPFRVEYDKRVKDAPAYNKALSRWTRASKIFVKLESKAEMSATYKNRIFIESYLKEFFKRRSVDTINQKKIIDEEFKIAEKIVFFISLYTPDVKHNDLNNANSIWNIKLSNDKNKIVYPESIICIDRKNIFKTYLFKYVTPWSRVYEITFPVESEGRKIIDANTKEISMIFAGLDGQAILKWNL